MNAQVCSAIRSLLKILAGYLAARGLTTDDSTIDLISGGITALIAVCWSWKTHKEKPEEKPEEK